MRAPEFWDAPPGLAVGLLAPVAAAWDAAARLRRAVARPYRALLPVVCVGNLVAGGSGKTPVVLSLARIAVTAGVAVQVVTRGYGGRLAGPVRVDPVEHDAAAVGDEAVLLTEVAPCWVCRDRVAGIRAAAAAGAGAVLLDDGFQNPSIDKDLSLLVIDAEYGFGNGRVMPAGPLREPVAAGLRRAGAIVLIGDGDPPPAVRATGLPVLRARLEPAQADSFNGARVVAFAGIGRPAKFFASLRACGAELLSAHPFPDHYRYAEGELFRLRREAEAAGARLVTTAKDWARLPPFWRRGIEVLAVEIRWQEPATLAELLLGVLRPVEDRQAVDGHDRSAARA